MIYAWLRVSMVDNACFSFLLPCRYLFALHTINPISLSLSFIRSLSDTSYNVSLAHTPLASRFYYQQVGNKERKGTRTLKIHAECLLINYVPGICCSLFLFPTPRSIRLASKSNHTKLSFDAFGVCSVRLIENKPV